MKQFGGWWFTDEEAHFPEWMAKKNQSIDGRLAYQGHKLLASVEQCKTFGCAVDVGGHIGTFSYYLAQRFETVHAFEPVPAFRECFNRNVTAPNVTLHACALGASEGRVGMHIVPSDTGGTYVSGPGTTPMRTLDSFELQNVSYLKIDCEGGELGVLQGAVETLKRCRPVCMVEQKVHKLIPNFGIHGRPALDFLVAMGARQVREMGGDHILVFD